MERADALVVGAGVIGLACARELLRHGVSDVIVLEASPVPGSGSSSRANGGFRAQFTSAPNIAFSLWSIGELEDLERATGSLAMHQVGYLLMTGADGGERSLRAAYELQRSLGVETEWLEPAEIGPIAPFVRSEGLRAATIHRRDGFLDPAGVVTALLADARARGADIRVGTRARAIARERSGLRIATTQGDLFATAVVNAAGVDAQEVASMAGADVPVEPIRRNLAMFLDPQHEASPSPMCVDLDTGVLARREAAGGWVVAYSDPGDRPGRDASLDPRFLEALAERVPNRFPFLSDLPVDPSRCWAGLYPETPDHHAIVGPDPSVPGLFHCVGFGGHGVMHAPAAGRAIAELVVDGASDTFDLRPLRPSRFAEGDLVVEAAVF